MANSLEAGSLAFSADGLLTADTAANLIHDAVEIVMARLDVEADTVDALAACLLDEERQRASRFHFERDGRRFIVARAHLRQLLAARLGVQPRSVELAYGPHGKPGLAAGSAAADWRFNVSRSRDIAVFAFCHGREVGIDIEAIHPMRDGEIVAAHFFSRKENDAFLALQPRDREMGFFNCWTRKEAFIKAIGDGLRYPLDHFDVSLAPEEPARILRVANMDGNECGWSLRSFSPLAGYVTALVIERCRPAVNDHEFRKRPPCTPWTH